MTFFYLKPIIYLRVNPGITVMPSGYHKHILNMPAPGTAFFLSMNIYLDESGDLGFSFKKPYRKGGSSRFLTITFLLVPKELSKYPKRIVKKFYEKKRIPSSHEIKGNTLTKDDQIYISNRTLNLLKKFNDIKIIAMTVNKKKVKKHIRQDQNKLYNYMIGLALLKKIKNQKIITLIPDKRSIKVKSGNSLKDYLQINLWFELNSETIVEYNPLESHRTLNLKFIDWISYIIWKSYENKEFEELNIFRNKIELHNLFF